MSLVRRGKMGAMGRRLLKSVIYEDKNVIAINKWPGLVTQGGQGGTPLLEPSALALLKRKSKDNTPRLVHRLDKPTSGVLVFARNLEYARRLSELFAERGVTKEYWAATNGAPAANVTHSLTSIVNPTSIHGSGDHFCTDASGAAGPCPSGEAEVLPGRVVMKTRASVASHAGPNVALLRLWPETGFTHQLRIQCALGLNTPLIGDLTHGPFTKAAGLSNWARRQLRQTPFFTKRGPEIPLMLHCRTLTFPGCGQNDTDLVITAGLPPEFVGICKELGLRLDEGLTKTASPSPGRKPSPRMTSRWSR